VRYLLLATHVPRSGSGGGIVRYTVELAGALHRRADVELHVLATRDGAAFFASLLPVARIHPVPAAPVAVRSLLERERTTPGGFDVVHGAKHLVPRRSRGASTVLTVHDTLLLDRPADFGRAKRLLLRRPYLASVREAHVLVCVSHATRARLLDYVPTAGDRVRVVPLAASTALAAAPAEPVPPLVGRPFALVIGDASARKNLQLVVDGWPRVRAAVPRAVLAVVGPPDWGRTHRGSTWAEQVADGVVLPLGHVTDGALRWCYEHASVVLCPSVLEGFGLPTVEALRFGAPVVTSEDPALCEAAGGRGVAVPARDRDGWVRSTVAGLCGERGRPEAAPRSWDDVARETLEAVRQVGRAC
jgi:glycosyltransferase involved in cell wall biosynthesis